jgi:protein-tyrosine phosphatase
MGSVLKERKLKELGITHVPTTNGMPNHSKQELRHFYKKHGIQHKFVSGEDDVDYDMIDNHYEDCKVFFQQVKKTSNGKVVVHCAAGRNRSALLAAAAMLVLDDEDAALLQVVKTAAAKSGEWS